ncbi:MAG: AbrB family transcriptional regulator, partial [Alcaligenaceae bacterium]|nr:AbrB family transcriptional regulator [Alcaligenaceae bacterium]
DGWLSILIGVVLAVLSMLAALLLSHWLGMDFAPLLLVFLPGGAPELGVMALALDIDQAMVTTHHMLRVLAIVGGISVLLNRFIRKP